ncbi:MAG: fumarate hydratase [Thermodesulfobacteriota bacterium]|nr:fumarate hydratase [Thermodesulfobacteriota bacterium]
MSDGLISQELISKAAALLLKTAATRFPDSYVKVIKEALKKESHSGARKRLEKLLEAIRYSNEEGRPICQDTGIPLYFVTLGEYAKVRGDIQMALKLGTEKASKETPLRENVVHPLTCYNPGTNVGWGIPYVFYDYKPGADYIEITAVTRGDGEDAPTTIVRIPSTGPRLQNIKKGILDVIYHSRWACPPHVIGICIGANVTIATHIALKASLRNPTGARSPDPMAAQLEEELLMAINSLGIGPAALGGDTTALAVHIELVGCHTISPALVIAPGCWTTGRFAVGRIYNNGRFEGLTHPDLEVT